MKKIGLLALLLVGISQWALAQGGPVKHPRVLEVEEKIRDEASRYFTRRFPQEPFFVRVEVYPLRRDEVSGKRTESLPYFDYESEESIDEWDDAKTPLAFLRHRVNKISVDISVPESFDDAKLASLKEELSIYLKLLPFRDEVKVERKLKTQQPGLSLESYGLLTALLLSSLVVGFLVRNGLKHFKGQAAASQQAVAPVQASAAPAQPRTREASKGSTAVSGDVTFHDPIKTIDIVHMKLSQVEKSGTFPTLKDLMSLHMLGEKHPDKLGAILCEMPAKWQKQLFPLGHGQGWLEAFSQPGRIDYECLMLLDRLGKEREMVTGDRQWEDLLIQVWRMEEKAVGFCKRIPQDHAFIVLASLPKSFALGVAKKAFPGAWGRLLENREHQVVVAPQVIQDYLAQSLQLEPYFDWKLLENYRKDRELLKYLDNVSIDDEKDVYETLPTDSFVLRVRPGFYRVFEQSEENWKACVASFPLEKWALAVMNSSRGYIRHVNEVLDAKQKVVFSQHLRRYDQGFDHDEQIHWRKLMAQSVSEKEEVVQKNAGTEKSEVGDHAQSA